MLNLTSILLVIPFFFTSASGRIKQVTVAQDGSGDFKTVQAALDAVPNDNKKEFRILVKNGIYKEKLHLDEGKDQVSLFGEDRFKTILTYDDHTGKIAPDGERVNTKTSYSFLIKGNDFYAENITFRNEAGFTAGQAVAVEADGNRLIFNNCRFEGNQDVLYLNNKRSRQFYTSCYIEGTTDFIFGNSTAWFEKCHIHTKKNSHITAASTPQEQAYGFVFYDCSVTGDSIVTSSSLGRPWQPYASVVYLHCYIDRIIRSEGWAKWNNLETYALSRFAEYKNYGPRGKFEGRVDWAKELSDKEADEITVKSVLRGWIPELRK